MKEKILKILAEDARTDAETVAVMLGAETKKVSALIKEMEADGTIVKYAAVINTERLEGEHVEALIQVKVTPSHSKGFDAIAEELYKFDEVRSLYLMSGGYDLTVVVEGRTLKEVALFVSDKLSTLEKVVATATHFILKKYKVEGVLTEKEGAKRLAVHV